MNPLQQDNPGSGNTDIEAEIRRQVIAERAAAFAAQPHQPQPERAPSGLERQASRGGILGMLAALALLAFKFLGPLASGLKFLGLGKFFLTGGSMLLSMAAYATTFGWPMGVGFVLSIFVHECGHAYAARRLGWPFSFMVFIPFMGAMVAHKHGGKNIAQDAYVGIMGPIWGTASGLFALGLYYLTGSALFHALAQIILFINLFNLAPMAPLDGGWIVPLFSPKLLAAGVVLLFVIAPHNPLIWVLALMSLPRVIGGWKAKPDTQPYYQATPNDRWRFGLMYAGLAAFLAFSSYLLLRDHHERNPAPIRRPAATTVAFAFNKTRTDRQTENFPA
jgi:Zn-dependent protease